MTAPFDATGMWRFSQHLPIDDPAHVTSLGEGDTAVIPAAGPTLSALPVGGLWFKAEYQNPTGSFKDRIAAVSAAVIRRDGLAGAVGTSSGNGGAAIAAYGARAGFPVVLFTLSGIVDGKLRQIQAHGAATHLVSRMGEGGTASDGVAPTIAALSVEHGWHAFLTGARYAPEAMRGAETIAFELAEQLPDVDVVYVPIGGGGLLGSIHRGYQRLGGRIPRLVGVQPAGCSTLARAVAGDRSPVDTVTTTISGLQVAVLFDWGAIDAVTGTGGAVVEVADEDVWNTQRLLAREEGVFVEPAGATALTGALAEIEAGTVGPDDRIAVVMSGAGHKDPTAVERLGADNPPMQIAADEVAAAFERLRP